MRSGPIRMPTRLARMRTRPRRTRTRRRPTRIRQTPRAIKGLRSATRRAPDSTTPAWPVEATWRPTKPCALRATRVRPAVFQPRSPERERLGCEPRRPTSAMPAGPRATRRPNDGTFAKRRRSAQRRPPTRRWSRGSGRSGPAPGRPVLAPPQPAPAPRPVKAEPRRTRPMPPANAPVWKRSC